MINLFGTVDLGTSAVVCGVNGVDLCVVDPLFRNFGALTATVVYFSIAHQ